MFVITLTEHTNRIDNASEKQTTLDVFDGMFCS